MKFEIVNTYPDLDIALIKVDAEASFVYLKPADETRTINFGEKCLLYGYPEGYNGIMQFPGTVSTKAERGTDGELGDIYYFSGDATPGDSGGPVVAEYDGAVIGILRGVRELNKEGNKYNYMKPLSYFWKEFLK